LNFKNKNYIEASLQDGTFDEEFNGIEELTGNANLVGDFTSALLPENFRKNRYKNILPFEKTRVIIEETEGVLGSGYISANFISGEMPGTEKTYVATQGPLQHTLGDFWRMIWEHKITSIVMLANEIENGKEKVFPYWPEMSNLEIDNFVLSRISQVNQDDVHVIIRKINIHNLKTGETREVEQLQYTGWPDQGLPATTDGFRYVLDQVMTYDEKHLENTKPPPILVHCSAGIGRTGVFCAVHSVIAKINNLLTKSLTETPNKLEFKSVVLRMREERAGMIQTQEQYTFCYHAALDKLEGILKILHYKNEAWFHKNLVGDSVVDKLMQTKSHGSFLFRPSNLPRSITLSGINGRDIFHARIEVSENGFNVDGEMYPTLLELVESRKQVLLHPILIQKNS